MSKNHVAFAEKENAQSSQRQVKTKDGVSSQTTKKTETTREFPSTPAGRVPLADLIGNNEENLDNSPRKTPIEAVSWEHGPMSSNTVSCMTPIMRRGKKRARSTSPTSSQKVLAAKPLFDPNVICKTPQNDPVADLENRYFARNRHQTPSKPSSSAAPDFMHSSSPVTPVLTSGESAKLRRTVSCGIAWPTGNKRRKLCGSTDEELRRSPKKNYAGIDRQGELQKINMLLDSIHDGLPGSSKSSQSPNPPSSCPLPNEDQMGPNGAPLPQIQLSQPVPPPQSQVSTLHEENPALSQHREPPQERGSSEFGDADVDLALAAGADPSALSPTYGRARVQEWPAAPADSPRRHQVMEPQGSNNIANDPPIFLHLSQSTKEKLCLQQDFDDDDAFDEFAADMELVASMYDEHPKNTNDLSAEGNKDVRKEGIIQNAPATAETEAISEPEAKLEEALPPIQLAPVVDISSDEEFGDDDFEEIANEIERATQAGVDLSTVRFPSQSV